MVYIKEIIFLLVLAVCFIKIGPMTIALLELYKAQLDMEKTPVETEVAKKELKVLLIKYKKIVFRIELVTIFKIFLFFALIRVTFYLCHQ